ncbi:hypothetical protein HBI47_242090 [Parastagonospora nodorum]|nr:hypothetical protein HBI47_242090 [Parastagonospora nodorum]
MPVFASRFLTVMTCADIVSQWYMLYYLLKFSMCWSHYAVYFTIRHHVPRHLSGNYAQSTVYGTFMIRDSDFRPIECANKFTPLC